MGTGDDKLFLYLTGGSTFNALFQMVAPEESWTRVEPFARTTELLERVFEAIFNDAR